jgi:hypothetical protein
VQVAERRAAADADAGFGRSGLIGFLLGVAAVTAGITAAGTIGGMGFGPALGVGACAGIWGGGGFGFLLGAVLPVARQLDEEARIRHRGASRSAEMPS